MYPYNRNTQLYHSRAKETQAEKPSLLAQDKRLEELLSLARTEATETTRKFETLLDRAELSEAGQILRTMYLDGKKHLRLLQEVGLRNRRSHRSHRYLRPSGGTAACRNG